MTVSSVLCNFDPLVGIYSYSISPRTLSSIRSRSNLSLCRGANCFRHYVSNIDAQMHRIQQYIISTDQVISLFHIIHAVLYML